MSEAKDLAERTCVPCKGGTPPLDQARVRALLASLHHDWQLSDDGTQITRRFATGNFARALALTDAVGAMAETQKHHPDLALGWGYCSVTWTTHAAGGLSENDFICAARSDALAEPAAG
jgi:4a-hydroxytetrahydrobiopterin dehydratase